MAGPYAYSLFKEEKHLSFVGNFCNELLVDSNFLFIYAGFVNQNFLTLNTKELDYLRKTLKHSVKENTRVIFDCSGEGICKPLLEVLHKIVDDNLDPSNVYYITSASNVMEIYERMSVKNRIHIRSIGVWESFMNDHLQYPKSYTVKEKEKVCICFNRVARPHRLALFGLMLERGLVEKSYYSYLHASHNSDNPLESYLKAIKSQFSDSSYKRVEKQIRLNKDKIPLMLNIPPDENATYIKDSDYDYFENSYFSLVTETLYNERDGSVFFSEKIFKPIGMKHPFILVNAPGSLKYLRDLGYRTFNNIIDETYDTINNPEERMLAIVAEVERLSKNTPEQWIDWQNQAKEIVEHNYRTLKSKTFKDFIYARS